MKILSLLIIFLFALSSNASSIPIPKLNGSVSYDQIECKWFLIIMSMCILIEGFVFYYRKNIKSPFAASFIANLAALLLVDCFIGVFLFLFTLAPSGIPIYFLLMLTSYVVVEYYTLLWFKFFDENVQDVKNKCWTDLIIANSIITALITLFIFIKFDK